MQTTEIPRLELSQLDPMSEKTAHKYAPVPGDVLTHQTRFAHYDYSSTEMTAN